MRLNKLSTKKEDVLMKKVMSTDMPLEELSKRVDKVIAQAKNAKEILA